MNDYQAFGVAGSMFIKMSEMMANFWSSSQFFTGHKSFVNMCVEWCNSWEGRDATNDLTYLLLVLFAMLGLSAQHGSSSAASSVNSGRRLWMLFVQELVSQLVTLVILHIKMMPLKKAYPGGCTWLLIWWACVAPQIVKSISGRLRPIPSGQSCWNSLESRYATTVVW